VSGRRQPSHPDWRPAGRSGVVERSGSRGAALSTVAFVKPVCIEVVLLTSGSSIV
jgi:hypothetical protein